MNCHPVTIAYGKVFSETVRRSIARFELLNDVKVQIIKDLDLKDDQSREFIKCDLWDMVPSDVDRILYFDADILPICKLPEIPDGEFCAAPDNAEGLEMVQRFWPMFKKTNFQFNAGMFIASRSTDPWFKLVKEMACYKPDHHGMYDQTLFNMVLQTQVDVTRLSKQWNYLAPMEQEIVSYPYMLHLSGMRQRYTMMKLMLDMLDASDRARIF